MWTFYCELCGEQIIFGHDKFFTIGGFVNGIPVHLSHFQNKEAND